MGLATLNQETNTCHVDTTTSETSDVMVGFEQPKPFHSHNMLLLASPTLTLSSTQHSHQQLGVQSQVLDLVIDPDPRTAQPNLSVLQPSEQRVLTSNILTYGALQIAGDRPRTF